MPPSPAPAPREREIENYSEILPNEPGDKYYRVNNGNLYLFYAVNEFALLPQHMAQIDRVAVPFIVRAVKRLGPGNYTVWVEGSASATGNSEKNFDLGAKRSRPACVYAIQSLAKLQAADPELARSTFEEGYLNHGDEESWKDRDAGNYKSAKHVEANQATYRASLFRFKARFQELRDKEFYEIREVYKFKFGKIEEDLPDALKKLQRWFESNPLGEIAKEGILGLMKALVEEALKKVIEAMGKGIIDIGMSKIAYMIPTSTDFCYEIKNYEGKHGLYRMHSQAHSESTSFLSVFKMVLKLLAIIGKIRQLAKFVTVLKHFEKLLKEAETAYKRAEAMLKARAKAMGKPVESMLDILLAALNNQAVSDVFSAPASDWTGFRFGHGNRSRPLEKIYGSAQRTAISAIFNTWVTVRFGYTPNHWGFDAEVNYDTWMLKNDFFGFNSAIAGNFALVSTGYQDLA